MTFVVSWILCKLIDMIMGMRLATDDETIGLDQVEHSESAYNT